METDLPKRRPGRPPNPDKPTESLGGVRVHTEQLAACTDAAAAAGLSRADWIRSTLDRAARRRRSSSRPATAAAHEAEALELRTRCA